jgi:DNA-binding MarR family transcriptional regulator
MGLQQELKQNRPFPPIEEATLSIVRTAVILENIPNKIFKQAGITGVQYNVLRILRGSPEGLCRNEVGQRLIANVPDVTRLLDRMEAAGLITRHRTHKDRRFVLTKITEKGLAMLQELDGPLKAEYDRSLEHLKEEDAKQLIALLEKLREPLLRPD